MISEHEDDFEDPVMIAFEYDEATKLYHCVTDKKGYELFQEFIDVYCSNVPEDLITSSKN